MKSIKIILRGVGQVMFQNNALTGLLFLAGIFYNSFIFGIGALLGNIIGTLSAVCFKYPKENIENGFYGFNATLVGIAVYYLFGVSVVTTLAIIIGAIFSTLLMYLLSKKVKALTAPFVIATWVLIFCIKLFILTPAAVLIPQNGFNLFSVASLGVGQVMFQKNIITGLIFLLGILVNSRVSFFYALYGSLLGTLFASLLSLPLFMISIGLFGYNAVLCGIALGNKSRNGFIAATFAILLSVLLNYGLFKLGVVTLTAPFVLATWITFLFVKR